ncbi:MAG: acyl-CoA dehydrogenase family protein [Myxococcota bacterium]
MFELTKGGEFLIKPGGESIFTPEQFTDEQQQFHKTAMDFTVNEVLPLVDRLEHKEPGLMRSLLHKAGKLGLLSVDIPERYEGLGLDKTTSLLTQEAMVFYGSWGVTVGAHCGIGTLPIVFFGNEEQKQKYLPKLSTAEWVAAYALTEAGSGSDALAAKTTARLEGDHYVLNGVKQWITNAGFADVFVVFAKINGEAFTGFIVERTDPGVRIGPEEKKMGIRGSSTCELILEEARIPKDRVLGEIGKGHRIAFGILNIGRLKLGVGAAGGAKNTLKLAVDYAKQRKAFGKTIAEFGMIRQKLGQMAMKIFVTESMAYRTSGLIDAYIATVPKSSTGYDLHVQKALEEYAIECSILKVFGSEVLAYVVDEGLQIFGGYGYTEHFPIERVARDARINRIFEGTNEINRMLIPGTALKRAVKGQLPLMQFVEQVNAEIRDPDLIPMQLDGSRLGRERRCVELSKRIIAYVCSVAAAKYMTQLEERQDLLAGLADLMIDLYAMDSAVQRAGQNSANFGVSRTAIQRTMTNIFVHDAYDRIITNARKLSASMAEDDELDTMFRNIARFAVVRPVNYFQGLEAIAKQVLEDGGYRYPV